MAIPFVCECGKSMSAKDEFAGRRLRCPSCQRVVTIPKLAPPAIAKSVKRPQPRSRTQPPPATMTAGEIAAMNESRPVVETPPPPDQTLPIQSAENLAALFAPSTPKPVSAPKTAPAKPPRILADVTPTTTSVAPLTNASHPWFDRSLEQSATPWRSGDEARFQAGIAAEPERDGPLAWLVPLLALAAAISLAVFVP